MNTIINFKKERELGDIISDTFKFLRLNFKPLMLSVFKYAGPALLVVIIAFVIYTKSFGDFNFFVNNSELFSVSFFGAIILLLIAAVIFYALLYCTVLSFIDSYEKNNGQVNHQEVKEGVKNNFFSAIGVSFLVSIISVFGFILCFFPGIYFGVSLSTAFAILIIGKKSAGETINQSFALIKGEWWITFATLFVTFILYYVIVFIGQIPQYIYFFIKAFTIAQKVSADPSNLIDWPYIVLSAIGVFIQYIAQTIIVITTAFIYFNLNEKKNHTGAIETIESLGNS